MQPNLASAAKATAVTFTGSIGEISNFNTVPIDGHTLDHFDIVGTMVGDIAGPFTWIEDRTIYYNNDGAISYAKLAAICDVTTSAGHVVIEIKSTLVLDGGYVSKTGSWTIVGGTGLMATLTGKGTFTFSFQFEGTIR